MASSAGNVLHRRLAAFSVSNVVLIVFWVRFVHVSE
jgi:hypothetical protein